MKIDPKKCGSYLETNVFSFFVAIEPQYEKITISGLLRKEERNPHSGDGFLLFCGALEQGNGVDPVPIVEFARKVETHDVPAHGRHLEADVLSPERARPFVDAQRRVGT